jgi:hypothetical protein
MQRGMRAPARGAAMGHNASMSSCGRASLTRAMPRRPRSIVAAAGNAGGGMPRGDDDGVSKQPPALSSLDDRILSGEFTEGSTKEQMTRPVRKILAQDPVGIGAFFWSGRGH